MMQRLGSHVHFAHLRNVRREDAIAPRLFHEDGARVCILGLNRK
jgi:D-mannonate dehydratase